MMMDNNRTRLVISFFVFSFPQTLLIFFPKNRRSEIKIQLYNLKHDLYIYTSIQSRVLHSISRSRYYYYTSSCFNDCILYRDIFFFTFLYPFFSLSLSLKKKKREIFCSSSKLQPPSSFLNSLSLSLHYT